MVGKERGFAVDIAWLHYMPPMLCSPMNGIGTQKGLRYGQCCHIVYMLVCTWVGAGG